MIPQWLMILGWLMIGLMFFYGVMFFVNRKFAGMITGHTEAGAFSVVGARFFFMGALGAAFLLAANWQAMAILLAIGALVAFFDAILEKPYGGATWPHAVACIGAAVLAYLFFTMSGSAV